MIISYTHERFMKRKNIVLWKNEKRNYYEYCLILKTAN
jgi:hypothetical protein